MVQELKTDNNQYMAGAAPIFIYRNENVGALLLHSYTSTPYEMRELAEYLAKRNITVYAPVLAGHGTTPKDLAETTAEEWQQSAEDAYLYLKEKVKKIFVVGSSFGGNMAFHLATKFTNPMAGVISLGTPIKVRWQKVFIVGLYTIGLLKKNQKKKRRDYRLAYDEADQVTYPVMPNASLRRFFSFIKNITIPRLQQIKTPCLIIQSHHDKIVDPASAQHIHEHLGSTNKKIFWLNGSTHALTIDEKRGLIFKTIHRFIDDVRRESR